MESDWTLNYTNTSDDKDIIFRSDDGSGGLADYLTIDGSAGQTRFNANALFFDNKYLLMGDGADLQMAHTGSHALITNATGNIDITNNANDGDMFFKSDDGSGGVATYIQLDGGTGKVNLRHYGNKKLETTSTGVDVTGNITSTGQLQITVPVDTGNAGGLYLRESGQQIHRIYPDEYQQFNTIGSSTPEWIWKQELVVLIMRV